MDYYEPTFHIYLNNNCIRANLSISEFEKEYRWMNEFLQLTNLKDSAILDFVQCDPPTRVLLEGSY